MAVGECAREAIGIPASCTKRSETDTLVERGERVCSFFSMAFCLIWFVYNGEVGIYRREGMVKPNVNSEWF